MTAPTPEPLPPPVAPPVAPAPAAVVPLVADPVTPIAPAPPGPASPPPPWTSENFDPAKAWELVQNLRQELKTQGETQRQQIAKAFGLEPEAVATPDDLKATVQTLQERIDASERKATIADLARQYNVPAEAMHMLTAPDAAGLKAQAEWLGSLVPAQQVAAAAVAANPPPAFAQIPGQGLVNPVLTAEQASQAGYAQFYDEHGRPRS